MNILVMGTVREEGLAILREFAQLIILPEPPEREAVLRHMGEVDAILHKVGKLGPEEMARQRRIQIIARHGVGLDYLDLDCIRGTGIPVSITTTANSNAVAEAAIGLMLSAVRHFPQGEAMLKRDKVWQRERLMGRELRHQTVGLVGYGRVGDRVARLLDGFGAEVLVYDVQPELARAAGRTLVGLDELMARADVISLHCPLTKGTEGMFDARMFTKMKKGVVLVNTARGALINKRDLVAALESGQVGGIATDSFDHEPPDFNEPIFRMDNALTTPHLAAMTLDAQVAMAVTAARELRRVLVEGLPPTNNVFA